MRQPAVHRGSGPRHGFATRRETTVTPKTHTDRTEDQLTKTTWTPSERETTEFPWLDDDPKKWAKTNHPDHWKTHDTGKKVVGGGQFSKQDWGYDDHGLPRPKHLKRIGREDGKQTDTPRVLTRGTVHQRASFRDQDRAVTVPPKTPGEAHPGPRGVKRLDTEQRAGKRCKTPEEFRAGKKLGARRGVSAKTGQRSRAPQMPTAEELARLR